VKPLRHPLLPDGRGRRTAATLDAIACRDALLVEAARRYCAGMSDRAAAAMLHTKLARYRAGAWRRTRVEAQCPPRHLGRLDELLWQLLRLRDAIPSERLIRLVLSAR
jgi:hypothetical protein